jgi:AcrR family transcriptional regulator
VAMVTRLTREQRRDLTRQQLLAAAAVVFSTRGYHAASIDDVADAAGFTKGAVYSNFASKEDLFLALIRERQEKMLQAFFAAAEAGAASDTTPSLTDVFRRLSPTPEEFALWQEFELYARRQPELLARLRADNDTIFAQLVALVEHHWLSLEAAPPLPHVALARLYVAIFDGLARQRALDPDTVPDELFAQLIDFVDHAINEPTRHETHDLRRAQ